jgi:hypothetical protein
VVKPARRPANVPGTLALPQKLGLINHIISVEARSMAEVRAQYQVVDL